MSTTDAFRGFCLTALLAASLAASAAGPEAEARGRYLISVAGCNDCHTPNYMPTSGQVPEEQWLTGSELGFRGPWGTTYPPNLRLRVQGLSEAEWIALARQPMRPPMPWFNLREMSDADLGAIYHYLRGLGAAGQASPAYAPPGTAVATPYIDMTPRVADTAVATR